MRTAALKTGIDKTQPPWVRLVQNQVESLRFGLVQITVHDSRVVQIERTEKLRLDKEEPQAPLPGASAKSHLQQGFVPPAEGRSIAAVPGEDLSANQATGSDTKP